MSDWSGIDEFIAVARAGSFTGGAKAIGRSTTHVSRAIQFLERRVQAQLFHRTTRTVRPTDVGVVFFEHCQRIARERDEAIALITQTGEPQGDLRVTCSIAMGERFVAPLLREHAKHFPMLNMTIELTNRVVDLIGEGFDIAVRTGQVSDPRLIQTRVASRTLHTCAAPQYIAERGRPMRVEDLLKHDCLIGTSPTWNYVVNEQKVLHRPTGRFQCNSGQAVIEACVAGLGICQLPEFYILPYLRRGMLELLLEDMEPEDEPVWAVYPQRRHLLPKIQYAVDCLSRELSTIINSAAIGQQ